MDYADWCAAQPDTTLTECCIQMNVGSKSQLIILFKSILLND